MKSQIMYEPLLNFETFVKTFFPPQHNLETSNMIRAQDNCVVILSLKATKCDSPSPGEENYIITVDVFLPVQHSDLCRIMISSTFLWFGFSMWSSFYAEAPLRASGREKLLEAGRDHENEVSHVCWSWRWSFPLQKHFP